MHVLNFWMVFSSPATLENNFHNRRKKRAVKLTVQYNVMYT